MRYIVRTWTKGDTDFQEDQFDTVDRATEYAEGSKAHGYEVEIIRREPDLFEALS